MDICDVSSFGSYQESCYEHLCASPFPKYMLCYVHNKSLLNTTLSISAVTQ